MKRALSFLMLSVMFVGSVGCSSAPKKQQELPVAVQAEEMEPIDQEFPETTESSTTQSADALSLGSGSSGRGH